MDARTRRLFEARVAGMTARLRDEGLPIDSLERLVNAWDDEAYARGIGRLTPAYWSEAPRWIREQSEVEREQRLRHRPG